MHLAFEIDEIDFGRITAFSNESFWVDLLQYRNGNCVINSPAVFNEFCVHSVCA